MSACAVGGERRGWPPRGIWWIGEPSPPLETFARLECVDAGVPPDDLQVEIRSSRGHLLGRGDLGWRLPRGGG